MTTGWVVAAVVATVGAVSAGFGLTVALLRARAAHRAAIEERGWLLERERRPRPARRSTRSGPG